MSPDESLAELARNQWGVFSRAQAIRAGLSVWAIHRRLATGAWVEVQRRVYRHRGGNDSWHQSVIAATLSLGPTAMASHRTAGVLWGLDGLGLKAPDLIDVTVSRLSRAAASGIVVHHSRRMPPRASLRQQIPVTAVARTLLDLAATLDAKSAELALASAVRLFPATLIGLERELRKKARGQSGADCIRTLVRLARRSRTDSGLEGEALIAMRDAALPLPRTQYEIRTSAGIFVARVDFAWPQFRVVVFADSRRWHLNPEAFEHDLRQRNALAALDWRVLAVTKRMYESGTWLREVETVIARQKRLLRGAA